MKSASLPLFKFTSLTRPALSCLTALILSLTVFWQTGQAQQQAQLTLVDIIAALRSKKVTLAERNKLVTDGVKTRGITFTFTPELEKELKNAGADNELLEAIKEKSPVIKPTATPQPKIESTPVPVQPKQDFSFYQNRGNSNFVMGEYDLAVADYNKAIELNAKEATVYFSRALAFYNKKSYSQAIADFDKVIELDPTESMAFYNRGSALEKIGNFEKALTDYQKAVELDPANEPAKNASQRLQNDLAKMQPTPQPTKEPVKETKKESNKETNQVAENFNPNQPVNVGSLKSLAIRLSVPVYPATDRQRNIEGLVTVQVTLDEEGKVVSAKATGGPPTLRAVSEDAARKSKFKPATVGDKAVKAIGFVNYNFKVN